MQRSQTQSNPRGWIRVPPPFLFAAPLLLGLFVDSREPLIRLSGALGNEARWLGIALIVIGAAHALSSVALFVRSRTTLVPHGRAAVFVTRGAYRWTRNPMYLGLSLIYLGISAFCLALWPVLLLPLPILALDRRVIPMEERQLEAIFGAPYVAYRGRVHRWL